jgi:hypothetical protein
LVVLGHGTIPSTASTGGEITVVVCRVLLKGGVPHVTFPQQGVHYATYEVAQRFILSQSKRKYVFLEDGGDYFSLCV